MRRRRGAHSPLGQVTIKFAVIEVTARVEADVNEHTVPILILSTTSAQSDALASSTVSIWTNTLE